jgi:hypothetical protein
MSTSLQLNRGPGGAWLRCARRFRVAILLAGSAAVGLALTPALAGTAVASATAAARPYSPMIPRPTLAQPGFHGVAAASAAKAWAVGDTAAGNAVFAYGSGPPWVALPHVGPLPPKSYLQGVAAVPTTGKALAVGYTITSGVARALIGHGNTIKWKTVHNGVANSYLYGVAAASATTSYAVGYRLVGTTSIPIILKGTGPTFTTWTPMTVPTYGSNSYLYGVAATSASNAWAVGYVEATPLAPARTLIYHWNGIIWSRVASPSPAPDSLLFGVTASTLSYPTKVWAVGGTTGGGSTRELILGLNTSGIWYRVPSADVHFPRPPLDSILYSVTFTPATPSTVKKTIIWAVGGAGTAPNVFETVILRHYPYGSPIWNQVTSPNPGTQNFLYGVSAFSPVSAWAVGDHNPPAPNRFLSERWLGLGPWA